VWKCVLASLRRRFLSICRWTYRLSRFVISDLYLFLFFCLCCCYVRMYEVVHLVATVAVTALQTVPLFLNRSIMIFEYTVHWVRCKKVIWSIRTITISCPRTSLLIREHLLVSTAASLISNLSLLDHQNIQSKYTGCLNCEGFLGMNPIIISKTHS